MNPFRDSRPPQNKAPCHRSRGQVMVMFVLMLPLLCGAAGILVDLGLIVRNQAQLRGAAAAAARAGVSEFDITVLTATDVITFGPLSTQHVKDAAQRVCATYRDTQPKQDALANLTCTVDIALLPLSPDATTDAPLFEYLAKSRDTTLKPGPGLTVPMSVRVTATDQVRLYFLPVLMRDWKTFENKTQQSAILVSGQ